jgi:hypothetical protein
MVHTPTTPPKETQMTETQSLPDPELVAKIVFAAFNSPGHPACAEILQRAADWLNKTVEHAREQQRLMSESNPPAG